VDLHQAEILTTVACVASDCTDSNENPNVVLLAIGIGKAVFFRLAVMMNRHNETRSCHLTVFQLGLLSFALGATGPAASAQTAAPPLTPALRAYVDFAMRNDGDAARGRALFASEQKASCTKCHSVDGTSSLAGPDLSFVGDKFPRRELIRAVLEPSATVAVGYGTTIVETRSGAQLQGIVKQAAESFLELKGADGLPVRIARNEIKEQRTSEMSLMPEGLEAAFTHQEFADLVTYLESLRPPASAFASAQGTPAQIPAAAQGVELVPFFSGNIQLNRPLWFGAMPGFTNRFVVLEHGGGSWIIERASEGDTQSPLLDLRGAVRVGGATGLLGLAFHPKFRENRKYYLKYQIVENGRISTLLVERLFAPDFKNDSGQPARRLLKIPAVTQDHNGGPIVFGPDGFLYVGTGDTGPQRDPQGHGQDMSLLLGKILRIDVDRQDGELPYAIPSDNPFRHTARVRPEIWACGFREPWRFSFDRATGDFWVGDVGQDRFEEVAIVRAGENHGWNVMEGFTPFSNQHRRDGVNYVPPVFAYSHRLGVSVTAGYVYRGKRAPVMAGRHICGDFESRRIWALAQTNRVLASVVEIGRAPTRIASFAEDSEGELYLVGYDLGIIYRLNLGGIDPAPLETRVVAETAEREPVRWRYSLQPPTDDWFRPEFNDSSWPNAAGGFGTRGTPGAVVRTEWRTRDIWLRREFIVSTNTARASVHSVALRLHHDEDTVVYLNGVEAARLPRWTPGYIETPISAEAARTLRAGRNVIAIHCRQNSGGQYIDAGLVQLVRPATVSSTKTSP
jgi:putative heme-binding domain-containing protein